MSIIFDKNADINGTSRLRIVFDMFDKSALERIGAAGLDPDAYQDDETGYDGWAIHGTFKGEAFNIYTRWGTMRIAGKKSFVDGTVLLDVDGLIAELTQLLSSAK